MTRANMASFIRKIAEGDFTDEEWRRAMVNHYQDIPTENARVRAIRIYHHDKTLSEGDKRRHFLGLADQLEQPVNDNDFYYKGDAAGILNELPPEFGEAEISYEPYRSGSHFELQNDLDGVTCRECEFMAGDQRKVFLVKACPAYGRLLVEAKI